MNKFNIQDFNPDGMVLADLCEWLNYLFSDNEIKTADDLQIPVADVVLMKKYLINKICACQHRAGGNINLALTLEEFCDKIYEDFGPKVIW